MTLSNNDVSIVLGMLQRGDDEHDIAAWFGENQGRINDAKVGKYGQIQPAAPGDLPPKGAAGPKGRRLRGAVKNAVQVLKAKGPLGAAEALAALELALEKYNSHEA